MNHTPPTLRAKILDFIREHPRCTADDVCAGMWSGEAPAVGSEGWWSDGWHEHVSSVERTLNQLGDEKIVVGWPYAEDRPNHAGWRIRWSIRPSEMTAPVRKPRDPREQIERKRRDLSDAIGSFARLVPEHMATLAAMQAEIEKMNPASPRAPRKNREP